MLHLVAACRGDRHERVAPRAHVVHAGSGSAQDPPDSGELVAVPPEIAGKIKLREFARGLQRPVLATFAPGDARHRMFVVEQRGAIRVIEGGRLSPKPFFTIGDLSDGNEEGLLGLAFAPDYATSGKLYVNYTSSDMATHVVEYRVRADGEAVDPKTARELVRIEQPFSNHNGGNLVFGPDGHLYTGMGDGGAANDPHRNGQNPRALLGKILRFVNDKPEIVHIGMRNPWRFAFDTNGDLYIGDVGQNLWEEVDVAPAGSGRLNFGWNIMEGTHCFSPATGCSMAGLTLPIFDYDHSQGDDTVIGGHVYHGTKAPGLAGLYVFGDFISGRMWTLTQSGSTYTRASLLNVAANDIAAIGQDQLGELYVARYSSGAVARIHQVGQP